MVLISTRKQQEAPVENGTVVVINGQTYIVCKKVEDELNGGFVCGHPFQRKRLDSLSLEDSRCRREIFDTLNALGETETLNGFKKQLKQKEEGAGIEETGVVARNGTDGEQPGLLTDDVLKAVCDVFAQRWKLKDSMSEVAFKGMMLILEYCLGTNLKNHEAFQHFVEALGFHTVFFWKKAVPMMYESDMQYSTSYRDALLFSLVLYDVNVGRNRLRELFAAVPLLRDSLLGKPAKRFEEAFHHLMQRRNSFCGSSSAAGSDHDLTTGNSSEHEDFEDALGDSFSESDRLSKGTGGGSDGEPPSAVFGGGLSSGHFSERVINVSNAPPVSLTRRKDSGTWEIGQGSGGLVSCCEPVMSQDPDNMWLACFGPSVPFQPKSGRDTPLPPQTNSLGLPIFRKISSEVHANILQPPSNSNSEDAQISDQLSLVNVLKNYSKDNYKLNPVVVQEEDYNTYYAGISNGLLWPALHNLEEYIAKDYDNEELLEQHWRAYIRVNYQFALNAVRNSRLQDFLWIHDYHLMLAGMIIQSLDPNLEVGFFLHIPFQPPESFFTKYRVVGTAVLRGLLRFTKVGFQTHRDRKTFLELIGEHLSSAKINCDRQSDKVSISHEGWVSAHGVFPVSVKNEEYLQFVHDPDIQKLATELRQTVIGKRTGKFFFGVERFDYTKGIREKLEAYQRFLENNPDRHGKDVFFQVAVINRRSVDTYAVYQDECIALANSINERFKLADDPEWKPIIFQTEGLPRPKLIAHFLAMDVGVVTPRKDGMNLVAKEMLICNPKAALMLSVGAGTEQQLTEAGFYSEMEKCYHRVSDLQDANSFAQVLYEAAIETTEAAAAHGQKLNEFLLANDIEKWSKAFLDPSWSHGVIKERPIKTLNDFYTLMFETRDVRRKITERIIKGLPLRMHYNISLTNARKSLTDALQPDSSTLILETNPLKSQSKNRATLEITNEILELDRDLAFLQFIESDSFHNVEDFLNELAKHHPISPDAYHTEIDAVLTLITRGDHFQYFFTDRDGTMKSYSVSYPASIQPVYSGVIQATFANRCTQYAAIVTSAPLLNVGILDVNVMPDGCYSFGASGGREWYLTASRKYKDRTVRAAEVKILDNVAGEIEQLLEKTEYQQFRWIGSGLQRHFGHITIAKQDVAHAVNEEDSTQWQEQIFALVDRMDPEKKLLHVVTTETDIKIYPHTDQEGAFFNKGHGISLFATEMCLDLSEGNILVCGDSASDIPMLQEALAVNPQHTYTVWVTQNEELQAEVTSMCAEHENKNFAFVSAPEVLLGAMSQATIREIRLRPIDSMLSCPSEEE